MPTKLRSVEAAWYVYSYVYDVVMCKCVKSDTFVKQPTCSHV